MSSSVRNKIARAAAGLALLAGSACGPSSGDVRITPSVSPADFKSLGRTEVYVEIEGTGNKAREVTVPIADRAAIWLLPGSLRLARWDPKAGSFEVVPDSRYDLELKAVTGVVDSDGVYTILGLSRVDRVLAAQLEFCRLKPGPVIWPGCREILCLPMEIDSAGIGWSDSLGPFGPEVDNWFGNVCDSCLERWESSSFPECGLLPAEVDTGDVLVTPPEDFDGDGLPNSDELAMGTNPLEKDTDHDGLWDGWEVLGYDFNGDGTPDVNLSGMGTNPLRKDLLVEVDWMFDDLNGDGDTDDDGEFSYEPMPAAIDYVVQKFADSPVTNPNGVNGINLIVNVDDAIASVDLENKVWTDGPGDSEVFTDAYHAIKNQHMNPEMKSISRYCLFIQKSTGAETGHAEIPGPSDDFVVALAWLDPTGGTGTLEEQTGTFMHELGHTLGLFHGGSERRGYEVNYPSVMNRFHQFGGVRGSWDYQDAGVPYQDAFWGCVPNPTSCYAQNKGSLCFYPDGECEWTYSQGLLEDVDEKSLNEVEGIPALGDSVDFNLSGTVENAVFEVDLQKDGLWDVHTDHDDWSSLIIPFPGMGAP